MIELVVEPEGLLSIDGLDGVALFPIADTLLREEERGKAFLLHVGGEIEVPADSSMMKTAKKYRDGNKLKIKGREFRISCATLYVTSKGSWKLEACINPIEQKDGCHCELVVRFDVG